MAAPKESRREFPFWLLAAVLIGVVFAWLIAVNGNYAIIFRALLRGVVTTLWVSVVAFAFACVVGLVAAVGRRSRFRVVREVATFYVEIVRGIPALVLLFYVAFVGAPGIVVAWNWVLTVPIDLGLLPPLTIRGFDMAWRAIFALTISYSAFLSEIFRAGIESVPKPQVEGAYALGLSRYATLPLRRPAAGDPHRPAAARQRLRRHDQGFGAGLVAGRPGHHPARQGLLGLDVPLLRDLQRRRLPLSGDDHQPVAARARAGAPIEAYRLDRDVRR